MLDEFQKNHFRQLDQIRRQIHQLLESSKFLNEHWDESWYFKSGLINSAKANPLTCKASSFVNHPLLEGYGGTLKCFRPGAEQERTYISSEDAIPELESGATLYYIDLRDHSESCASLCTAFEKQFGCANGRLSAFLSLSRAYMPFHWDRLHNFTIQLGGRKIWYLAKNRNIRFPINNHALNRNNISNNEDGLKPLKQDFIKIIMNPGDLLYLPRGVWHATRTISPSFSISLSFEPITIAQHLAQALLSRSLEYECLRLDTTLLRNRYSGDFMKMLAKSLSDDVARFVSEVAVEIGKASPPNFGVNE